MFIVYQHEFHRRGEKCPAHDVETPVWWKQIELSIGLIIFYRRAILFLTAQFEYNLKLVKGNNIIGWGGVYNIY